MATLLLLRHGRTTANVAGVLAGRTAVELDDTGAAQAEALRSRLAPLRLARVVSSPLARCRQTLARALPEADVTVDDRLTECGYGDWEGRAISDLTHDPLWPVVQHHPAAARFPGTDGESMAEMALRVTAALREWDARVERDHGEHALWLACLHGDPIKATVADALGLHLDLFQRIVVDPASVTVVRYTATRPFLLRVNDTGQLRYDPPAESAEPGVGSADSADAVVGGGAGADGFGKVEA